MAPMDISGTRNTGGRPICFLSDFGLTDDFAGTCKGVMMKISPGVQIIDLTHQVPGFAIETGVEVLKNATRYMPEDAVYLAVVDPGVGTERREIALRTESGALMVGPDNGLLVPAAESLGGIELAVWLSESRFHVHPVSSTFHGRDVFAPVAAHLSTGVELHELGEAVPTESLERPDLEEGTVGDGETSATITDIDRFGNARLSLMDEGSDLSYGEALKIDIGDGDMDIRYFETFGSAQSGELVLVPDSHWRLSVAINKGNASQALSLSIGGRVSIKKLASASFA